jgi:hypothetical protein
MSESLFIEIPIRSADGLVFAEEQIYRFERVARPRSPSRTPRVDIQLIAGLGSRFTRHAVAAAQPRVGWTSMPCEPRYSS